MDSILNPDYRDMIECLQREGVEFMLVGGFAVMLYGWPRTTFDIDFWIMSDPANAAAVVRSLRAFGAPLMDLTEADFHKPGMVFQIGNEPQCIDIISTADGLDYVEAASRAVKMTTLKEQDEALCLSLSLDDRLRVLEELNRMARAAAGFIPAALDRSSVRVSWRRG